MKVDYEIKMRWAIAEQIWKEIKGQTCISTYTIVKDDECPKNDVLWAMYKIEACKSGSASFKMSSDPACALDYTTTKKSVDDFLAANEAVAAMLKEYDKKVEDLTKVFNESFFQHIMNVLKSTMIVDTKQLALTSDQAMSIIAHEILMNSSEYQGFLSWWRFWSMGVHYLRVKTYQLYAGIGAGVLVLLLLLGKGSATVQKQTIVIRR